MTEKQYAVPKFSQYWTKKGVPERRGLWDGKSWADVQTQIEPPEPPSWDRARRSRPTIWAHAAAFYESLRRKAKGDAPFASPEIQIWAGLLVALYKGDLDQVAVDPREIDSDLPAAFREGLPFDPADWPPRVGDLHGPSKITVVRSSQDKRPLAVGYAPAILVPALWLWEDVLAGLPEAHGLFFDELMQPYSELEGYTQGFELTLSELIGGSWPDHWFHILLSAFRDVVEQWKRDDLSPEVLAKLRSESANALGYRWGSDEPPLKVDIWEHYPLKARRSYGDREEDYVLFIPDHGLDEALNPWLGDLAFPGSGDTETRIGGLQVAAGANTEVLGVNGDRIPLPAGYTVISLNPRADRACRLLREELVHLVGEGARLADDVPLDPVHDRIHGAVARGHKTTSLLPIDGGFLARFRELRDSIVASFQVRGGAVLPQASEFCEVSLELPIIEPREVVWRPRNVLLKSDDSGDVTPRIDLWPDFETSPASGWRLYLLRAHPPTSRFRFWFPELNPDAQRSWDGGDTLALVHDAPPTLAELADDKDPNVTHGVVAVEPSRRLDTITSDPHKSPAISVDFGTTNTSVAFQAQPGDAPEVLRFEERSWPLLEPADGQKPPPAPGWVFDENQHRGFFSTAIGVREEFKQDLASQQQIRDGAIDVYLLTRVLNTTELSGLKLQWLANYHDSDAVRGLWEFHDQLKWSSSEENDPFRLTLRACFMIHLFLHALAEVQAQVGAVARSWRFTHPLSMRWTEVEGYEQGVTQVLKKVLRLAAPGVGEPEIRLQDESRAIFNGFLQSWGKKRFPTGQRVVIADMGGGSVDYAVFGERNRQAELIRSDSLRLAGQHFFQFTEDVADAESRASLTEALEIHFTQGESANVVKKIGGKVDDFRKAFNWTLVSSLIDKGGEDASALRSRLRQLAEERAPLRDSDHLAIWLGRLVRAVLGHAVLLGCAPIDSEEERVSDIEIVLAGNGWSLLPYCGHQVGDEQDLGAVAQRALSLLNDIWSLRGHRFQGPSNVKVRALERAVGGLPEGVYSKDLVALGGLAQPPDSVAGSSALTVSSGIVGADLKLSSSENGDAAVRIPWFTTTVPDFTRANLKSQGTSGGGSFFETHSVSGGHWQLVEEILPDGEGESRVEFRVPEQLYIYALLDPKNEFPAGRTRAQVEDWNGELEERARAWLEQVNAGATSTDYDRTSLVRGLWEYYFDRRIRPHMSKK